MIKQFPRLLIIVCVLLFSASIVFAETSNTGVGSTFELKPPSQYTDLTQLADAVAGYVFKIALPIAFGMIIYAGVRFILARDNPQEVQKAKDILKYTIIGLAIVMINKGFFSLIADVLGVQAPSTSNSPSPTGTAGGL